LNFLLIPWQECSAGLSAAAGIFAAIPQFKTNIPDISDLLQLESWRMRVVHTLLRLSASPPLCYLKEEIPLKPPTICSNNDAPDFSIAFFHTTINMLSAAIPNLKFKIHQQELY
jgi:hypothetical protein